MTVANIAVVLLAAGLSRRMGQNKLLRRLPNGQTLLEDRLRMINEAGIAPYVARPAGSSKFDITNGQAISIAVSDNSLGLGHSLSVAVRALPTDISGIMVLLADLPDLTADDLRMMIATFDGKTILRGASSDGKPGHPVIFPTQYRPQLEALSGDHGARSLLTSENVQLVRLPGQNAVRDLDTPADWDAWTKMAVKTPRR